MASPKPANCLPCESPTAQLLERPTGIWKVVGSISAGAPFFLSEYFLVVLNIYFRFITFWLLADLDFSKETPPWFLC